MINDLSQRRSLSRIRRTMARRGRFPRGGVVGQKRKSNWIGPADQTYLAIAGGNSVIHSSFVPSAVGFLAPTIVRTRGIVDLHGTTLVADVDFGGAYGICVVSDEAFAAGTASIPRPFDDADWGGWLVWGAFARHQEFLDGTGTALPNWSENIDSKAMRKVGNNETIVALVESQTGSFDFAFTFRMLQLLS